MDSIVRNILINTIHLIVDISTFVTHVILITICIHVIKRGVKMYKLHGKDVILNNIKKMYYPYRLHNEGCPLYIIENLIPYDQLHQTMSHKISDFDDLFEAIGNQLGLWIKFGKITFEEAINDYIVNFANMHKRYNLRKRHRCYIVESITNGIYIDVPKFTNGRKQRNSLWEYIMRYLKDTNPDWDDWQYSETDSDESEIDRTPPDSSTEK